MLIIEEKALPNGAHRSQYKEGAFLQIPEGWAPVMPNIEAEARGYLPFIVIDETDRGWITAVSQGIIPEPEPEPEPEPTLDDRVSSLETTKADQTDVDELNEALDMILTGYAGEEATDAEGTAG